VLDGGGVVQHGTHDQLVLQGGLYHQLWEAQNGHDAAVGRGFERRRGEGVSNGRVPAGRDT
jgi:hypothetical protein